MAENIFQRQSKQHKVYQRGDQVLGRLASRMPVDDSGLGEQAGQIVINFPAMPDQIPLVRNATYQNWSKTPITPDGFHTYSGTDPLEIPIKFSIHAFDFDYCGSDGPVAILAIAARLHALAMPITGHGGNGGVFGSTKAAPAFNKKPVQPDDKVPGTEGQITSTNSNLSSQEVSTNFDSQLPWFFPPACELDIVFANFDNKQLGIRCDGFITRVSVILKSPWLQGGGTNKDLYNLPTSADFEFTFVHQPGYTNNFSQGALGSNNRLISTSALNVFNRLYNSIGQGQPDVTYAGIDGMLRAGTDRGLVVAGTPRSP